MPEFDYTALGRDGVEVRGKLDAATPEDLARELRRKQLTLMSAKPARKAKRIPLPVLQAFVSELSPMLGRGVGLDRALQIVGEDTGEPRVAALAASLRQTIKRGDSFSQALAATGQMDSMMVALVRVGETSGDLPQVLAILESHYQESRQVRRDLVASLTYPAILAMVSLLSIVGLALYVIPVFRDLFDESMQASLPLGTRILFAASDVLLNWGWLIALVVFGGVGGLIAAVRHSDAARLAWDRLMLALPGIGELNGRFAGFKLAKALSLMLERGVPLVQAAEIARALLDNRVQLAGFEAFTQAVRKGEPIPQAFARVPGLPVQFHRYVKLGNETGSLGESLGKAAELMRDDFRNRLKSFVAILDPLIIVTMGGVVAFMVISILLAVFGLSDIK